MRVPQDARLPNQETDLHFSAALNFFQSGGFFRSCWLQLAVAAEQCGGDKASQEQLESAWFLHGLKVKDLFATSQQHSSRQNSRLRQGYGGPGNARGIRTLGFRINFGPSFLKFFGFLLKTFLDRCGFIEPLLRSISSNVFRYPHTAKLGTAHRASWKASIFAEKLRRDETAGQGIARRKVMGVTGKTDEDDEFAALAQLESA
jgi:hypothetical protein